MRHKVPSAVTGCHAIGAEIKKLSARQIDGLPSGKHNDGGGLWLHVGTNGTKSWTVRVAVKGKRRETGIGPYPEVSLAEARRIAGASRLRVG